MNRAKTKQANRLVADWRAALELRESHDGTFGTAEAEQKAYDALVEFVEQNDLNGTSYDPR